MSGKNESSTITAMQEFQERLLDELQEQRETLKRLDARRSNGGSRIWQILASIAGTALLAFGGLWLTYGQHAITEDDVKELLDERTSPIIEMQKAHNEKLDKLGLAIWRVETEQVALQERLGIRKSDGK